MRRICLLREQGDTVEASRLQTSDLAAALDTLRREQGAEALDDGALDEIFAAEMLRINEATLLADLLIPRLVETWNSLSAAIPLPRAATASAAAPEPAPVRATPPVPSGPPAISDLLDAMLAAERMSTRMSPAQNR